MKHYLVFTLNNQRQIPIEFTENAIDIHFSIDEDRLDSLYFNYEEIPSTMTSIMEILSQKTHITIDNKLIIRCDQISSVQYQQISE
jgi:hypothetical protein